MFNSQKFQIVACIISAFSINYSVSQANQQCSTPDRNVGTCIDIIKCPPLLHVLRNAQRTTKETQFLQQSQCDQVGSSPYVCCNFQKENRLLIPTNTGGLTLLPTTRDCGKSFDNRIYGGNVTRIDEYPWLALIEYTKPGNKKGFHCGATLINNRYVITAAHCVTGRMIPVDWRVTGIRLGEWDRSTTRDCERSINNKLECSEPHLDVGVEEIIYHPNYASQSTNKLNDIAIIRLNQYVTFSDFVSPVCLPVQSQMRTKTFEGLKHDVTGFGATESDTSSDLKLKASVDAWPLVTCRQKYATKKIYLQETQMCAGGQTGVDSCSGDFGGPLVIKEELDNRDVYVLAGIVSFGPKPCGLQGWPGVYTRVGAYVDWILSNIKA